MNRVGLLACVIGLVACIPSASVEPSTPSEPAEQVAAARSGPRYARASPSFTIHADPNRESAHLDLQVEARVGVQRVVELRELDESGGWWRIRTLLPREALALGLESDAGVAVLSLEGWVEAAQLVEFEPSTSPPANASMVAEHKPESPAESPPIRFTVTGGTVLRWPDGRVAGEVMEAHGFFAQAVIMSGTSGQEPLLCHQRRVAPGVGVISGWLCTIEGKEPGEDRPDLIALDRPAASSGEPTGTMDRDVIRGVVLDHIHEVRDCYNVGLSTDPTLTGRVAIKFVISGDGSISAAIVVEDSLPDPTVGACIAAAVGTWRFPKPKGGGNVTVTYPFNLKPG